MRVGFWEILVVLVVALVLFGPSRLPEMGRSLGKAIREFRQATADLGTELSKVQQDLNTSVEGQANRTPDKPKDEEPAPEQPTPPEQTA
jgi:TatA/E family protein of Tat protein translocase